MGKPRAIAAALALLGLAAMAGYTGHRLGGDPGSSDGSNEPHARPRPEPSRGAGKAAPALAVMAFLMLLAVAGYVGNEILAQAALKARASALTRGGDPDAGARLLGSRPCGGCHVIPGIHGATGKVGPSLAGFSGRLYIAGRLANTPDNLQAWLIDPHAIDPQNVMPPTGLSRREACDVAAYLYTVD